MAMGNGYRNDRFENTNRGNLERGGRTTGYRQGKNGSYERYGADREGGRSLYGDEGERYAAGDREHWTTDDLGYSDQGYSDRSFYRGNEYDERERGYGRQYGYGNGNEKRDFLDRAGDEVASWFGDEQASRRREMDQFRGKGPKGYKRTDERILEDVNDRLTAAPYLDASDIEVAVFSSEVTLSGFVRAREDKRRAEDIADDVFGVSHVQNNLRVKSSGDVS